MCGITGIIDSRMENRAEAIKRMTDAITHRGPDDDGYFTDDYAALGMRRLSIIDLAKGQQPIASSDGRYLIFFNGEIYNYKEIKRELSDYSFKTDSDTEVILAGFMKWKEGVLGRLRGMFTFCIYDTQEKKIFLARDFFGIKPLYYLKEGSISAFSSEIKSFFQIPGFKPEVNDAAVYNYLSFQYNPLEETFFKNVYKLSPAHFLSVDLESGRSELKRYWQFRFKPEESLDEGKTKEKILETMKDSVAHHMIADVPVGSFLSGVFFTSIFTAAPATVMLYEIAQGWSALPVALIGALGAVVGDLLIFRFIRDRLTSGLNRKWIKILHLSKARFLAAILGGIVIASPLPDELGLALMGLSNVRQRWIIPMSFVFNFLGILAIGLLARQ